MDWMTSLWPFDNVLQHHVHFAHGGVNSCCIQYHYICENFELKSIQLEYIPTTFMSMDIFIKSLFQGPIPYLHEITWANPSFDHIGGQFKYKSKQF